MEKTSIRLSEHFTLAELTKTKTNLTNVPNEAQVANLKRLCGWLEELRSRYNGGPSPNPSPVREGRKVTIDGSGTPLPNRGGVGGEASPIVINSAFRSAAVNKAVGGAATSNHLTGCAADIRVSGMEQALRYAVILLDISDESREDFDELLIERNARGAIWLHFAVRPTRNRRKLRFIS